MSEAPYSYRSQGRSLRAVLALIFAYTLMAMALVLLQAAWWLVGIFALLTLPALWELWRNPQAGLDLDSRMLHWHSGRRQASVALSEIDYMRFDTRWDFSVRVTAILKTGGKMRLPQEVVPAHRELEAAFDAWGIPVRRHHFTVF